MIGTMWFDPSEKSLRVKVEEAKTHLELRYDKEPNVCYVNPDTLSEYLLEQIREAEDYLGIEIKPSASIMKNHFFIGIEKKIQP